MFDLEFHGRAPNFLCHPRFDHLAGSILDSLKSFDLSEHYILLSSGTTSEKIKGYGLSRKALEINAKAVNDHFSLTSEDVWALSLPPFHVGGLSVILRAKLLGNRLVRMPEKWNPTSWSALLEKEGVTITTVVPTQVFDLVGASLKAPPKLKFLIVGGDFLSQALEERALALGWPIIRTFGMTEVCSQLASAKIPGGNLELLPIHEIRVDQDQRLRVKSESLFTLQFIAGEKVQLASEFCDDEGFYLTQDRVRLEDLRFTHLGRLDDQIKISGKLVPINDLRDQVASFALSHALYGKIELIVKDDPRKGKTLQLLHLPDVPTAALEELKKKLAPASIEAFVAVDSFERTDLGKLKRVKS